MSRIQTFKFTKDVFGEIKKYHFGYNWPVVYLLEDGQEIYIGESTNVYHRSKQHYELEERKKLKNIHIVSDEEFNKSAALDIESLLIEHVVADEKYILQNGNKGISGHNYYDRQKYLAKFELLWDKLRELTLVQKSLQEIRNSQIFKYSPYKTLTEDQIDVALKIKSILRTMESGSIVVHGGPGTGKTILATYLVKNLLELDEFKHLKIGFVVPMTPLRKTIKKVFSHIKGLKSSMVIGPNEVIEGKYDLLLVDESHRLKQRVNITNYKTYDDANKKLGFDNSGTELDWILASSRYQIFFYDKNQSVRPADISESKFAKLKSVHFNLHKQKRVKGGERYIKFIEDMLNLQPSECNFEEYDFRIFNSVQDLISEIKLRDEQYGLSRVVAGYAWPWKTKYADGYDIDIDGLKLIWNSTMNDWVNSENAINEVGCIHTVQGYDLNYTGVII
ncbi:MAG: DUF2075 domain-containing protein, partial [Candidatus Taylorbacteria bacterium]|nr:DUF2075 domain-containing protein [Candidatus Taylorbacteria bacterium]